MAKFLTTVTIDLGSYKKRSENSFFCMYKGNFFLQTCFVVLLMRAVHQVPLGQPQE